MTESLRPKATESILAPLLEERAGPCLSLYQPTHRHFPDNRQDPLRFKNLCNELEQSLQHANAEDQLAAALQRMRSLLDDSSFWNHALDGLALFASPDFFQVYRLQREVPEFAVVATSFHTKPLVRVLQSADRYHVLALDRHEIKLFEGNRDALDEIQLAPGVPRTITEALGEQLTEPYLTGSAHRGSAGGQAIFHGHGAKKDEVDQDAERFFRAVDRAIHEHHSRVARLPLVLAALPQYHTLFRRVSHNPMLTEGGIEQHPDSMDTATLRDQAWNAVEPQYRARLDALVEEFGSARPKGFGTDQLQDIAHAAVEGRVATLLVDAEMRMFHGLSTPVIFLQNVVVDLLLGLGFDAAFGIFAEHVRSRYGAAPGFITMNLPAMAETLVRLGIDDSVVCFNLNKIGFRMSGSFDTYADVIREARFKPMAMSVLASGAIPPREAIEWVCAQPGLESIVFGASSRTSIRSTVAQVDEFWPRATIPSQRPSAAHEAL